MTRFSALFPVRKEGNSPSYIYAYSTSSISQMTLWVKESGSATPLGRKQQVPHTPCPALGHSNSFNRRKSKENRRQKLLQLLVAMLCSAISARLLFITAKPVGKPWPQLNQWQKFLLTSVRLWFLFWIIKRIFSYFRFFVLRLGHWTLKIKTKKDLSFSKYFPTMEKYFVSLHYS